MPALTVQKWVDSLQASGRYTFLRSEAVRESGGRPGSVRKALHRLAQSGRIAKVKDYFFVIVPLEYQSAGAPPASWFVHQLMAAMEKPYYVALLSAAGLHGASHQQPQELQVMTSRSLRPVRAGRVRIRFFANKQIDRVPVVNMKTPTGTMRVSTPEATAVDLVRYPRASGQLGNVATVLSQLLPLLDGRRLAAAAAKAGDVPAAQRLGYLLDLAGARRIAAPLAKRIKDLQPKPVLLRPDGPAKDAEVTPRWQVILNETIEIES
jgi:predicted transcriptional regulator of viral defense system